VDAVDGWVEVVRAAVIGEWCLDALTRIRILHRRIQRLRGRRIGPWSRLSPPGGGNSPPAPTFTASR
jgi:hypothetical protein